MLWEKHEPRTGKTRRLWIAVGVVDKLISITADLENDIQLKAVAFRLLDLYKRHKASWSLPVNTKDVDNAIEALKKVDPELVERIWFDKEKEYDKTFTKDGRSRIKGELQSPMSMDDSKRKQLIGEVKKGVPGRKKKA